MEQTRYKNNEADNIKGWPCCHPLIVRKDGSLDIRNRAGKIYPRQVGLAYASESDFNGQVGRGGWMNE
jgi:hypothetical protein